MSKHFSLKNDKVFISIVAPGGTFNSDQLVEIANFTKDTSGILKITEDQRIGIILNKEDAENNISKIQKMGLIPLAYKNPSTPCPKVCLGDLCPLSEQNALTDAMDTFHYLQDSLPEDFPYVSMGINGCSKSCTHSATDDIHIVAESSGYRISVGGKNSEIPVLSSYVAENIPPQSLGETVHKILNVFKEHREDDEKLHETVERLGPMPFQEALGTLEHEAFEEDDVNEPEIGDIESPQEEEDDIMMDLGELTDSVEEESTQGESIDASVDNEELGENEDLSEEHTQEDATSEANETESLATAQDEESNETEGIASTQDEELAEDESLEDVEIESFEAEDLELEEDKELLEDDTESEKSHSSSDETNNESVEISEDISSSDLEDETLAESEIAQNETTDSENMENQESMSLDEEVIAEDSTIAVEQEGETSDLDLEDESLTLESPLDNEETLDESAQVILEEQPQDEGINENSNT